MSTNEKPVKLKCKSLSVEKFEIQLNNFDKDSIREYLLSDDILYKEDDRELEITWNFKIKSKDNDNPFLELIVLNEYLIHEENAAVFLFKDKGRNYVSNDLLRIIRQSTYDTLRGIVYAKTENILDGGVVLPAMYFEKESPRIELIN